MQLISSGEYTATMDDSSTYREINLDSEFETTQLLFDGSTQLYAAAQSPDPAGWEDECTGTLFGIELEELKDELDQIVPVIDTSLQGGPFNKEADSSTPKMPIQYDVLNRTIKFEPSSNDIPGLYTYLIYLF